MHSRPGALWPPQDHRTADEQLTDLRAALERLPPREALYLHLRLVEGWSRARCASHLGVAPEAFDVHLLRAACALCGQPAPPRNEEERSARALALALERDEADHPLAGAVRRVRGLGPALKAVLIAEEEAEQRSPHARRRELARRVVIAFAIGLTAYLYFRSSPP